MQRMKLSVVDVAAPFAPDLLVTLVGSVCEITINRPERRNAMSFAVMRGLRDVMVAARDDNEVRVVVLSGAGEQAFCAGADLGAITDNTSFVDLHDARGALADVFRAMWSLGKPTIAKVRGFALAGGFGLACACDIVVAAVDAIFGTPEINVGLWPYMITVPLLRTMPPKFVLDLMMTGRRIDVYEAQRVGVVSRVVATAELAPAVRDLADELAKKSPIALRFGRESFFHALEMSDSDTALDYLQTMLTLTTNTDDAAEGVAAFAEKRAPNWTGR